MEKTFYLTIIFPDLLYMNIINCYQIHNISGLVFMQSILQLKYLIKIFYNLPKYVNADFLLSFSPTQWTNKKFQ